jgi:N-acetylglucosaminyl-diphospho-decaprenol L-rhamnosyltransferase
MNLLIVIVNYRVADLTIGCLRSLREEIHTVPEARVAVCENGTGDDSARRIARVIQAEGWQDWVSLTSIHPNRGFTGGNNVILRDALAWPNPPRYFLLLNADTIVRPGALRPLVDFMDTHPQAGIAGSRLEDLDGTVQCSAFRFPTLWSQIENGLSFWPASRLLRRWTVAPPPPRQAGRTDWVSGACLIVRREVLQTVGLLDEDLYTYFDDVDICMRARRAGWSTWYVPQSRVMHLQGQTTGINTQAAARRLPEYWFWARRHFFLKNYGACQTAFLDAAWILCFGLWRCRRRVQRKCDPDPAGLLLDSVRFSVFATGFKRKPVPNPALTHER